MKKWFMGLLTVLMMVSVSGIKGQALMVSGADVTVETVADLKDTVENAEMDKVIKLGASFPTNFTAVNTFNVTHNYNITIDGQNKVFTTNSNVRHFDLKNTGTGIITLTNMELVGLNTIDGNNRAVKGAISGGIIVKDGHFVFETMHFTKINGSAIKSSSANTFVTVKNSTFDYNTSPGGGGAIDFESGSNNLSVYNCAFFGNYTDQFGYSGGAIFLKNAKAVDIVDSVFMGNETKHLGGAVAFTSTTKAGSLSIKHSYFEGNRTIDPVMANYGTWADAGAVGVYAPGLPVQLSITDSTFTKNSSFDDGGAMMIENPMSGATTVLTNNTFFENTANGLGIGSNPKADAPGGAIQFSLNTNATLENNTIAMNKASGLNAELVKFGSARGGGIGFHYDTQGTRYPTLEMKNNLMYGNYVTDATDAVMTSDFSNITISHLYDGTPAGTLVDNGGNLGIDNGLPVASDLTSLNVFGVLDNQLTLRQVYDLSPIGVNDPTSPYTYYGMPILPIMIKDGTFATGLAHMSGVASVMAFDANHHNRSLTTPNIGAVEEYWVKFDGNGATYNGLLAFTYDGTYYYDTTQTSTQNFYKINYQGAEVVALSAADLVHPNGAQFLGWSTTIDGAVTYMPGDIINLTDNMTLYAQWQNTVHYTVTYDGNGSTKGVVPSDSKQYLALEDVTVAQGSQLEKTGYTFVGWNTAADGKGVTYNGADSFKISENTTLYALWQENAVPVITPKETLPSTGDTSNAILIGSLLALSGILMLGLRKRTQNN